MVGVSPVVLPLPVWCLVPFWCSCVRHFHLCCGETWCFSLIVFDFMVLFSSLGVECWCVSPVFGLLWGWCVVVGVLGVWCCRLWLGVVGVVCCCSCVLVCFSFGCVGCVALSEVLLVRGWLLVRVVSCVVVVGVCFFLVVFCVVLVRPSFCVGALLVSLWGVVGLSAFLWLCCSWCCFCGRAVSGS